MLLGIGASSLAAANDAVMLELKTKTEALFKPGRNLAEVKLSIGKAIDPAVNVEAGLASITRMAHEAQALANGATGSAERLAALRRYIYEAGPWK